MNAFDFSILSFLNRFEGQHPAFDGTLFSMSAWSGFLKAGLVASLFWWGWFMNGEDKNRNKKVREIIISAMLACVASLVIARLVVLIFPFRVRPIADPTNGLHFPSEPMVEWQNWSSFPSDHAIMFFTLTTCLFYISRGFGWIALLYSTFLICLPRIYLGIHYPTDVLAGATIGVGMGIMANREVIKNYVSKGPLLWMEKHPGSFYAFFFLFMYQVTDAFQEVVYVAGAVLRHHKHLFH